MNAQELLEKANAAMARNDLDEAEQLYSQITGSDEDRESEIFQQAVDAIWEIRRLRGKYDTIQFGSAVLPGSDHDDAIQFGSAVLPGSDHDDAIQFGSAILPGSDHDVIVPEKKRNDAGETSTTLYGATIPVLGQSSSQGAGTMQEADTNFMGNAGIVQGSDSWETGSEHTRKDVVASKIEDLNKQAESYRRSRTRDDFKAAIAHYETILGYEMDVAQRRHYERCLDDTRKEYEDFQNAFGALTTARQLEKQEEQLIQVRLLQNKGLEFDDKGNRLVEEFEKLTTSLRKRLLQQASEQEATAIRQVREGIINLEISQLHAAVRKLDEIIGHLRGENITSQQAPDANETIVAINGIRNILVDYEDIRNAIQGYQEKRNNIEQLHSTLEHIVPFYEKAEAHFRDGDYVNAIDELERIRSRAGESFQRFIGDDKSWIVNDLYGQVHGRWEDITVARARQLLLEARAALDRGDRGTAQKYVVEIIGLEPSLKSKGLEEYRREAEHLQESIGLVEKEFTKRIKQASEERNRREFDKAKKTLQGILSDHPGHEEARKLLDLVLQNAANALFNQVDDVISRRDEQKLNDSIAKLREQDTEIKEIHDRITRTNLEDRIEETISQVNQVLRELEDERAKEERFQSLLQTAQTLLGNEDFTKAEETLHEARTLKPGNEAVSRLMQEVHFDWSRKLKKEAQTYLRSGDARAAMEALDKLSSLGVKDETSINALRRQAYTIQQKERGKTFLMNQDYRNAIEAFLDADLRDGEVIRDLQVARQKEAERLIQQERWEEVLQVLQQVDLTDTTLSAINVQARAEVALKKANQAIDAKDFDDAEKKLQEAEQVGYGKAGFPERLTATRKKLANDRIEKFFQDAEDAIRERNFDAVENFLREIERIPNNNNQGERISWMRERKQKVKRVHGIIQIDEKEAEKHYRDYQATQNVSSLLDAIRILENLLKHKDLQDEEMSILRETIASKQLAYQGSAANERGELLNRARAQNLRTVDGLRQAARLFNIVLGMRPDKKDADAEAGMDEVRRQLRNLREHLVDRTRTLLNIGAIGQSRGILLSDVKILLGQINEAQDAIREIDPRGQQDMNSEIRDLQGAQKIFERAEPELRSTYQMWANQRKDGTVNLKKIEEEVQRIVGHYAEHKYTHSDLDMTNPNRTLARCKQDQEALERIEKTRKEIDVALQNKQQDRIIELFGNLRKDEEIVMNITEFLVQRGVSEIALPHTVGKRNPRQHEFLSKLVEKIRTISASVKEEASIESLRQLVEQKRFYQVLLDTLDHNNQFQLREQIPEEPLDLRKLDEWQTVFESGKALIAKAEGSHQKARQEGKEKRWREGIELFNRTREDYATAIRNLQGIIEPEPSPYLAVHKLQEEIEKEYQKGQQALSQLENEKPWLTYQQKIDDAMDCYEQARTALRNDEHHNAIELAKQAMELDPTLEEGARKVIRHAEDARGGGQSSFPVVGCVVLLVIAIVLVALAFLFGPALWSWFSEFFFPPVATVIL